MSANHTPGPWSLSDEDGPLLSGADGAYIAEVFSRTANGNLRPHYAADARLIASAPALLAALQMFDRWPAAHQQDGLKAAFAAARAAINRAIGEEV